MKGQFAEHLADTHSESVGMVEAGVKDGGPEAGNTRRGWTGNVISHPSAHRHLTNSSVDKGVGPWKPMTWAVECKLVQNLGKQISTKKLKVPGPGDMPQLVKC